MEKLTSDKKYGLTIREAADYFNIGESSIRRLLKRADPSVYFRVGKKKVIRKARFQAYMDNLQEV